MSVREKTIADALVTKGYAVKESGWSGADNMWFVFFNPAPGSGQVQGFLSGRSVRNVLDLIDLLPVAPDVDALIAEYGADPYQDTKQES